MTSRYPLGSVTGQLRQRIYTDLRQVTRGKNGPVCLVSRTVVEGGPTDTVGRSTET